MLVSAQVKGAGQGRNGIEGCSFTERIEMHGEDQKSVVERIKQVLSRGSNEYIAKRIRRGSLRGLKERHREDQQAS